MGVNVAKGKDSSGHNLRGIQRAPMKILLTVSNEYYKKIFFYHWGKYPNSFVILQGFNLMLTKAIFIYWQPYVAFVNILQKRDVWKYVFDLSLNIFALLTANVDMIKIVQFTIKIVSEWESNMTMDWKYSIKWWHLGFHWYFKKSKSQKEFDQTDENIPEGRRLDKFCWGEVGCWQQLVESGQLQQRGGELP